LFLPRVDLYVAKFYPERKQYIHMASMNYFDSNK
jgi:hypothetical protein